jgi:hypothetical protein
MKAHKTLMLGLFLMLGLLVVRPAHAIKFIWLPGTVSTWINGTSTLTNNSLLLSSAITLTDTGYTRAVCELAVPSFPSAPAANTGVSVWIIKQVDGGSNYEDGDASTTPARMPDMVFPLRAVSTAQRVTLPSVDLPPGLFKALLKNDGTGVTMNATWTLKCLPFVLQTAP